MNKRTSLIAAAAILATMGTVGVYSTMASTDTTPQETAPIEQQTAPDEGVQPVKDFQQALADHFNLDIEEVEAFFEEYRAEKKGDFEERAADRLNELVTEGTITQEQADALTSLYEDGEEFRQSLADLSPEERREAVEERMEEVKAWAEEQGLDEEFPLLGGLMKHRQEHGGRGPFGGGPLVHDAADQEL